MSLIWYLIREATRRFFRDGGFFFAAAVAFFGSISVFPLLMLGFTLLVLFVRIGVATPIFLSIADALVPNGSFFLRELIEKNMSGATNAGVIGILVLLYAGMAVFGALEYTLDRVFECTHKRTYARFLVTAFTMSAAAGGIIVLASFFRIGAGLLKNALAPSFPLISALFGFISALVTFLLMLVIITLIYVYVPSERRSFQEVMPGSLFSSFAVIVGQTIFSWILQRTTLPFIFGSLTAIIALLIWIDVLALLIIIGAEIAAAWTGLLREQAVRRGRGEKVA